MKSPLILHIRHFRDSDLPELYKLLSDPEVMRFLESPFSPERTKAFLENAGLSDPPLIYAAENDRGSFIGYVIFHDYDADSKEIGWVLKKDVWGKGCAKELTKQLIEKANSKGKSVIIECIPEQRVTKHIAELFGFAYTGKANGCDVYKLVNAQEACEKSVSFPFVRKGGYDNEKLCCKIDLHSSDIALFLCLFGREQPGISVTPV